MQALPPPIRLSKQALVPIRLSKAYPCPHQTQQGRPCYLSDSAMQGFVSITLSKAGPDSARQTLALHQTDFREARAVKQIDWTSHPTDARKETIQSRASDTIVLDIIEKKHVTGWDYRRDERAVNQNST